MVSLLKMHLDANQPKAELIRLQALNQKVAASISTAWTGVNRMFIASAASIAAMGGAFLAAYSANAEFNRAMTHTRALGDLTAEQMDQLGKQVNDLAVVYGESANTISDGLVILAKAGLTQQQIMTAMPTIVQLMKANAVDFETAANIAMMTINAFGKEYSDLTEIADHAQKTFQATLMDIEDLQQGLQYAGSTAQLAGISFDSLLAMMGTLADNAMVAGIASRSMNQMMLDMVDNVDEIQRWADAMNLGVNVVKEGKLNIDEILPAFNKLGMSLDVLTQSHDIFNTRAMRAWAILIANSDEYLSLLDQVGQSSGELQRTTDIQITSLQTMMTQLKEMLFAPFRTPEMTKELAAVLNQLRDAMKDLGPSLAYLVLMLTKNFARILPDLIAMVTHFVKAMHTGTPLIRTFANIITGMNPGLLKAYILFSLLKKLNIVQMFYEMALSASFTTAGLTKLMTAEQLATYQARRLTMAQRNMASSMMGVAFGAAMAVTGYDRESRALGVLVTAVMAAAAAYQYFAVMQGLAKPWMLVAGVAAAAGIATAALSYAVPMKEPEKIEMPEMPYEYPEFTGTFQRGTRYVPETSLAVVHRGEQISSANKEPSTGVGASIVYDMRGAYIGPGAIAEIEKELAKRGRRALGRLPQ